MDEHPETQVESVAALQQQVADRKQQKRLADEQAYDALLDECWTKGVPNDVDRVEAILDGVGATWDDLSAQMAEWQEDERVDRILAEYPARQKRYDDARAALSSLTEQRDAALEEAANSAEAKFGGKIAAAETLVRESVKPLIEAREEERDRELRDIGDKRRS